MKHIDTIPFTVVERRTWLARALTQIERRLRASYTKGDIVDPVNGRYLFVANDDNEMFTECLATAIMWSNMCAGKYNRPSFLDVGCGYGFKCVIADQIGAIPSGIEVVEEYAGFAGQLVADRHYDYYHRGKKVLTYDSKKHNSGIFLQDALDFPAYNKFDIIYYYCPIQNAKQANLERMIERQMKVGAILMPVYKRSGAPLHTKFKKYSQPGRTFLSYDKHGEFIGSHAHDSCLPIYLKIKQ